MKKLIFTTVVAALLLGGLSSCNDNKAEFSMFGSIIAIEQNGVYRPIVGFEVFNGTLAKGSVQKDGMPLSGRIVNNSNLYEVYSNYAAGSSLSAVNGAYIFSAESTEGDPTSLSFNFKVEKELGDFDYKDFTYNGSQISFVVTEAVENATNYGFYVFDVYKDAVDAELPYVSTNINTAAGTSADQKVTLTYNSTEINSNYINYVIVYPVAAISSSTGVLLKLGEPKYIYPSENSFRGDNE